MKNGYFHDIIKGFTVKNASDRGFMNSGVYAVRREALDLIHEGKSSNDAVGRSQRNMGVVSKERKRVSEKKKLFCRGMTGNG